MLSRSTRGSTVAMLMSFKVMVLCKRPLPAFNCHTANDMAAKTLRAISIFFSGQAVFGICLSTGTLQAFSKYSSCPGYPSFVPTVNVYIFHILNGLLVVLGVRR